MGPLQMRYCRTPSPTVHQNSTPHRAPDELTLVEELQIVQTLADAAFLSWRMRAANRMPR